MLSTTPNAPAIGSSPKHAATAAIILAACGALMLSGGLSDLWHGGLSHFSLLQPTITPGRR